MLNPVHDKNEDMYPGGRKGDTCDYGLSNGPLRVKLVRVGLESKSDDSKKNKKIKPTNQSVNQPTLF